jgi:predicted small lipoprotein YifL
MKTVLLMALLGIAGCGQKGPLYFAEPEAPAEDTVQQAPAAEENNDEDTGDETTP